MITVESHPLLTLKDTFETLVDIAGKAVGLDPERALQELNAYALRGMNCTLLKDDGVIVGYALYGTADKFLKWTDLLPVKIRLAKEGIKQTHTACHIHVLPAYLKGGNTARMSVEYCQNIVAEGGTHLLLYGYATDELCEYSFQRPGGRVIEGLQDFNGRRVGVRDLAVYLAEVTK